MQATVDLRTAREFVPHDAARKAVLQRGVNGRAANLVRRPAGVADYELDASPDDRQLPGLEALLGFHDQRIQAASETRAEALIEFTPDECAQLFAEAGVCYRRLIVLFRRQDWPRAEHDTAQIMQLLDSVRQHARQPEDRVRLEPWRPHLQSLHAVAHTMNLLARGQYREFFQYVRDAGGLLEALGDGVTNHGLIGQVLLESVWTSLAALSSGGSGGESLFLRQNDFWKIQWQGRTALLKHTRGLQCLALLLRSPGREFHVSELLASLLDSSTPTIAAVTVGACLREDSELTVNAGLEKGLPILDPQAKLEYQHRVIELREELAEAQQFNDPGRAARAQEELDVLAQHLASAIGLGGRDRTTSSAAERARCAVTKRIKTAIQKISEALPALGHHFATSIKTGYFCSYQTEHDHPIAWKL